VILMLLNAATVWLRGRATHRMTGFYLVSAGAVAILSALQFGWKSAAVAGVLLTTAGSFVSAWRRPRAVTGSAQNSPAVSRASPDRRASTPLR